MKLDQFLKWHGMVSTGGEAKYLITAGRVTVNGIVENRRGRKLTIGDHVSFGNFDAIFSQAETQGRMLAPNDQ